MKGSSLISKDLRVSNCCQKIQNSNSLSVKSSIDTRFRLQGTDGIRGETKLTSSEITGLTPQEIFLNLGFITQEFMEVYAYAHAKYLISKSKGRIGESIIIGWDPRDKTGSYTSAVIRGVRKAGLNAKILGVVPTPLVPMYMLYKNALAGFMITASHNPKDQNGIKTFCAFKGLKPLPENDVILTRAVLGTKASAIDKLPLKGKQINSRLEALKLFHQFSLEPTNTWVPPKQANTLFKDIFLVVDPANGSLSKIAARIFRQIGFGKIIEVNSRLNGNVNFESGVADLEGHTLITTNMVKKNTGIFSKHVAIKKLLELGYKNRNAIIKRKLKVCGAVFDADGDRFYRLEYDVYKNALIVLNGDSTAFLQAKYLMASNPKRYKGSKYINSIESDINTAKATGKLGFRPILTSVGDKWILLKIAKLILEKQLLKIKNFSRTKILPPKIQKKWKNFQNVGTLDLSKFEELEIDLLRHIKKIEPVVKNEEGNNTFSFAIGSEETGHNITQGYLIDKSGKEIPVFLGNGLKSAINTFTATQILLGSKPIRTYLSGLTQPFPTGFKETFYVYYIKKELFYKNSEVWNDLKKSIYQEAQFKKFNPHFTCFKEEPDMLYISLVSENNERAAIFIRTLGPKIK